MDNPIPWLILFLPLASAACITLFTQRKPRVSATLSVGAIFISLLLTADLFVNTLMGVPPVDVNLIWLKAGHLTIHFGMHFDALSQLMLLIVTGVGSAIHLYSVGYMKGDPCYARFFACLSLFTFSMLGIVLSNNFFEMFIFWELVGVCSYLLIGFWYERAAAADAAKKAFLCNRLGDFGFFCGILLVWAAAGTLDFAGAHTQIVLNNETFGTATTAVGLLIFCGAVGKSAQFPLHVWLPDAMEGPTPVSALIHAATMVAAGVYMLCRVFFIFNIEGSGALQVVAWIGGITALMAALIACQQNDIKRILAYSTLSQLGYMVMAVGLREPPAAMFHLTTHAFFKALLFLGAGSVIHAVSGEQDIWKMGRLKEKMPVTYWTFLCATLALCGFPFFSGFYSKDAILAAAWKGSMSLFAIGIFVAFLTTFYMFRLFFVTFLGQAKSGLPGHAHESPAIMTGPLLVLGVASVFGGFIGIQHLIAPVFDQNPVAIFAPLEPFKAAPLAAGLGLGAFALGFGLSWGMYAKAVADPLPAKLQGLSSLLRNKFYFDELYAALIAATQDAMAVFANGADIVLAYTIRGIQGATELTGRVLRLLQTGNLQTYTFLFAAGIALVLYYVLLR